MLRISESDFKDPNLDYSTVMARFYLAYIRYKKLNESTKLSISPYDDIEDALLDGTQDNICASGACQIVMVVAQRIKM